MKRLLTSTVLGLSLLIVCGDDGYAQGFEDPSEALERGDFVTALEEWRLLAEQGDATAQYVLGLMYANGQGVIQDLVYAHMWLNIAAANGDKDAIANRDRAAGDLSSEALAEAQRLARECVAKNYKGC